MTWPRFAILISALAVAATSAPLAGQPVSVQAVAQIASPPVTGAGIQAMRFGAVAPGDAPDVLPGPAPATAPTASAGWMFNGVRKGLAIELTLTLPATLTLGPHAIPIDWDNPNHGTLCVSRGGPCILSLGFNPALLTLPLFLPTNSPGNNFDVTIYAGARAVIPNVPPGTYTASVTLTLTYVN